MKELKNLTGKGKIEILNVSGPFNHQLSHQTIHAYFYHLKLIREFGKLEKQFISVSRESLPEYAFPRLIERYLIENEYME